MAWYSAVYPLRKLKATWKEPVSMGFCYQSPNVLPRWCTWCGAPTSLTIPSPVDPEIPPIVVCETCDMTKRWLV